MACSSRAAFTLGLLLLCGVSSAMANSNPSKELLAFIGLQHVQPVANMSTGISFSSNNLLLPSVASGGNGAFAPNPMGTPIGFINGVTGAPATSTINVSSGFATGIYNLSCTGFPSYCNWTSASLGFSGMAKSGTFTGPANGLGVADVALNQTTSSVPEPPSVYLLATGLMALTFVGIRRFRKT